jgi:hypothetical protein
MLCREERQRRKENGKDTRKTIRGNGKEEWGEL